MRAVPTASTTTARRTKLTPSTWIAAAATARVPRAVTRAPTITSPATTRTPPATVTQVTTGTAEASAVTERALRDAQGSVAGGGRPLRHGERLHPGRRRVASESIP